MTDLLDRIRSGDAIAVHCFYEQVEPFLRGLARRCLDARLRRHADSEDIAQSAFRRILSGSMRARFADETRVLSWMAAIVRNRVRTLARHPEDRGGAALSEGLDPAAEASSDPAEWAACAEEVLRFRDAMERLPDRERAVVAWRDIEGLSYGEIAGLLPGSKSPDAVRKVHDRAIERLRRLLGATSRAP